MRKVFRKIVSLLLAAGLLISLTLPAAASEALGEGLISHELLLNQGTRMTTGVFQSGSNLDLRRENFITYAPNGEVKPIVTYGSVLTEKNTVSQTAQQLEAAGYRVVAGMNGDFYNVNNGLPIGIVMTEGELRSSDAGYYAVGFRADGTAVLGRPAIQTTADLTPESAAGAAERVLRTVAGINKARVSDGGIYVYTHDFNAAHTTGTTEVGVNVVCSVAEGRLAPGQTVRLKVEQVMPAAKVTPVEPGQIVLSANLKSNAFYTDALLALKEGQEVTLTSIPADPAWNGVEYAVGALYSLVENGDVVEGLPSGANPRTAIGQKEDGTLVFYTIDGRREDHSVGASMKQVAGRLIELGCVRALCLDGGGSTTLAVTQPDAKTATLLNLPSGGSERAVSNHVFLVADGTPTGELGSFHMSAENQFVLAGSRVRIHATAIDTNHIPMENAKFDLRTTAGTLEGSVLTTPVEGGDIMVGAEGGNRQGITTIRAVARPDRVWIRSDSVTVLSTLNVAPGTTVQLRGGAVYGNIDLKADPECFDWSMMGSIGTVDENGVFRAQTPGTGTITAEVGDKSATIRVTVSEMPLMCIEDFETEETVFSVPQDESVSASRAEMETYVRMGRASGALFYTLTPDENQSLTARIRAEVPLDSAYSSMNLWVYGDGSGNVLNLLYRSRTGEEQSCRISALDFTGWRQVSAELWDAAAFLGFEINGGQSAAVYDETGKPVAMLTAAVKNGTIYLDQMVASFCGVTDQEVPSVSLTQENGQLTARIRDEADGILPASALQVRYDGAELTFAYNEKTGVLTAELPESNGMGHRVTVIAEDASGNLGRASLDLPAGEGWVSHFTDMENHWSAPYVEYLYTAGITGGYADGTFRPGENISRAQFAVMLFRHLKLDGDLYAAMTLPFADRDKIPAYALPAIKALYTEGIINGSAGADGRQYFNPGNTLTRAQAAAMLGRTMEKGYASAELTFTDAAAIPNYAKSHIQALAAIGVFGGYEDGSFRPGNYLTRGQTAKILYNLM